MAQKSTRTTSTSKKMALETPNWFYPFHVGRVHVDAMKPEPSPIGIYLLQTRSYMLAWIVVQTWTGTKPFRTNLAATCISVNLSNILPKHLPPLEVLYDSLCGFDSFNGSWLESSKLAPSLNCGNHFGRVKEFEESSARSQELQL